MASGKTRDKASKGKRRSQTAGLRGVSKADVAPPKTVEDLFGGGYTGLLLRPEFSSDQKLYAWFQKRHEKAKGFIDEEGYYRRNGHEWKVPYGIRMAVKERLTWSQMAHKYPFFVTWVSPKTGKRLKKYFMSLPHAIVFVAEKAQYVDEDAAIVCRQGFDIPPKLRGKFPRKMNGKTHYWCGRCMAPRIFRRQGDQTFFAMRKEWSTEKARYEFRDRKLALLGCTVCGVSNNDSRFRRNNQPWEIRKFKKGVRRAKVRK